MKKFYLFILLLTFSFSKAQNNDKHFKNLDSLYIDGKKLFNENNYAEALNLFLKIDSISTANNLKNEIIIKSIIDRAEIARLNYNSRNSEMAEKLLLRALSISKEIKSEELINKTYVYLADASGMVGKIDKAKEYLDLAFSYYKKKDDVKMVSRLYLIYTSYYFAIEQVDKGLQNNKEQIEYLRDKNDTTELANALIYYGNRLIRERNDNTNAIVYFKEAEDLYLTQKDTIKELYSRLLRDMARAYKNTGKYKDASSYFERAYWLKIDLYKKNKNNVADELETKYQTEKKEQQIALLKSEKELTEEKQKSQRNILIGSLGLTTVAGLFLFFLYKNRQKTNTKLKELDKVKSNFFANISHEFRTPLTLITHPIEKTLQDESISKNTRDEFTMAKQNSDRLLSLVNQLLDLSKIDAGQLKLRIQKSNPIQLISAISESFNYRAEQKQIKYSVNAIQNNEQVWFDKDALEKITINLISNALKYTPEKGSVICNASIKDDHLRLEVKNTGKGLTQDEVKHIFQRFYRTSEDNQGTGIGLALVKELVELHKGNITVKSTHNEWTTFTVTLSVDKHSFKNEQFINTEAIEPMPTPITQETINEETKPFVENDQPILLIVEDNTDVRSLLKQTFKNTYNIITAVNGDEGINLALEHIPDIIISDVMMPVKDGIELTNQLKNDERTCHIPIILLTAKAGEENELIGIKTGADDYVTKPFSSNILKAKVAKIVETRALLHKRYSQEVILTPKDIAITDIDEQFLEKVKTALDNNLIESSFSVEDFSKAVGMSRMQLHRKLKALTGLSASEFIRSQRLKLAAQLLKSSDTNISQVGYAVGFNDHSYFTKCFKEAYKCTPTEYANRK